MAEQPVWLLFEQVSVGRGSAPDPYHDPATKQVLSTQTGMITICPHRLILREGWMTLVATGQRLIDLIIRCGHSARIHRSALPRHCDLCAKPEESAA